MHNIKKLSVEINGSISNELKQKINEILPDVIEKYFDKFDIKNKPVLIDKIHFDLGTINIKNFEDEFIVRISYLLQIELEKFFAQTDIEKRLEEKAVFTETDAFIIYLQSGYSKLEDQNLDTLFDHLLKTNISLLRHILSQAIESETMTSRLFHQLEYEKLESYWDQVYPKKFREIKSINQRIFADTGLSASEQKGLDSLQGVMKKLTFDFMMEDSKHENVSYAYIELLKEQVDKFKIHEHLFKNSAFQYLATLTEKVVKIPGPDLQNKSLEQSHSLYIMEYIITGQAPVKESLSLVFEKIKKLKEPEIKEIIKKLIAGNKLGQSQFSRIFNIFSKRQFEYILNIVTQNGQGSLASRAGEIEYVRALFKQLFSEDIYPIKTTLLTGYLFSSTTSSKKLPNLINGYVASISVKKQLKENEILRLLAARADKSHHKYSKALKRAVGQLASEKSLSEVPKDSMTKDPMTAFMFFLKSGVWVLKNVTPHEILLELIEKSPEHLIMELKRTLGHETIWLRIAYQLPVDTVQIIFEMVFKEDDHLQLLISKLNELGSSELKELLYRKVFEAFIISKSLLKEEEGLFEALFEKTLTDLSEGINSFKEITDLDSSDNIDQVLGHFLRSGHVKVKIEGEQINKIIESLNRRPHELTSYIEDQSISAAQWRKLLKAFKEEELVKFLKVILMTTPSKGRWVISIASALKDGYLNKIFSKSILVDLGVFLIKEDQKIEAIISDSIKQKKDNKSLFVEKIPTYFDFIERISIENLAIKDIALTKNEFSKAVHEIDDFYKSLQKIGLSVSTKYWNNVFLAVLPFSQSVSELVNRFINQLLAQYPHYEDAINSVSSAIPISQETPLNFSLLVHELIDNKSASIEPFFQNFETFERYLLQVLQKSDELWFVFSKSEPKKLVSFLKKVNHKTIEFFIAFVHKKYSLTNFEVIYRQILSSHKEFKKDLQYISITYGLTHSSLNDFEFQRFISSYIPDLQIVDKPELIKDEPKSNDDVSDLYIEAFLHYLQFDKHIYLPLEQDGISTGLIKIITYRPYHFLHQLSTSPNIRYIAEKLFTQIDKDQQLNVFIRLFPYGSSQVAFVLGKVAEPHTFSTEEILSAWVELYVTNSSILNLEKVIEQLSKVLKKSNNIKTSFRQNISKIGVGASDEIPQEFLRKEYAGRGFKSFTISKLLNQITESGKFPYWLNIDTLAEFSLLFRKLVIIYPELIRKIVQDNLKTVKATTNLYKLIGDKVFKEAIKIIEPRLYEEMIKFSKKLSAAHISLGQTMALREHFLLGYVAEYYMTQAASSEHIIANLLNKIPFNFGLSSADYNELLYESDEKIIVDYLINIKRSSEESVELDLSYKVNLLIHLLIKNELPWWAAKGSLPKAKLQPKKLIKDFTTELLAKNPKLLFTTISRNPNSEHLYKRVFTTLTNQQFDKLLLVLNPDFGGFVISFNLLVLRSGYKYDKTEWFLFLFSVLTANMKSFNASKFVENALSSFARLSGKDINKLIDQLLNIAKEAIQNGEMRFLPFMELLNKSVKEVALDTPNKIKLLLHLLINTEVPDWAAEAYNVKGKQPKKLIKDLSTELLTNHPKLLVNSISKEANSKQIYKQIFTAITNHQFDKLILDLNPDFGGFIISFNLLVLRGSYKYDKEDWFIFLYRMANIKSLKVGQFIENALSSLTILSGKEINKLRDQLLNIAKDAVKSGEKRFLPFLDLLNKPVKKVENLIIEDQDQVQIIEKKIQTEIDTYGFIDSVDYYIRTGSIPYGSSLQISDYPSFLFLIERQLQFGHNELRLAIGKSLALDKIRTRLIKNENERFLNLVVKILYGNESDKARLHKDKVIALLSKKWSGVSKEILNEIYYQSVFEHVIDKQTSTLSAATLITSFIQKAEQLIKKNAEFTSNEIKEYGLDDALVKELSHEEDPHVSKKPEKKIKFDLPPIVEEEDLILDHRVLVNNAGLVITWPYLTRYFELLDMVENGKFKTEEEAIRAVHLLQFIATGSTLAPEHELLLNKVLCGLKIATPVPQEITLTDKEIETSEMMLKGLIQNWSRLKSSSIEALRQGFLIRDGYILEKDKTWELKVEKKTLDILMEDMPWAFGTIKLSWMEKRLNVEWI